MTISFTPTSNTISSITQSNPAVITTDEDHGYHNGLIIKVFFPFPYYTSFGMPQINGLKGQVTVISSNSFSIPINSTAFTPFSITTSLETPQVLVVGQTADSFINDSTQVNPENPATLAQVQIFQRGAPQFPCGVYVP